MGLTGKLIAQIEFKHGGDVLHELIKHKPHHISNMVPHLVQGCDLHEGEFGKVGSKICWTYTHEGKVKKGKQVIEAVEEENKLIKLKLLEGDLMEEYKDFIVTIHVETKGNIDMVSWTLEYEMRNEDVSHPISLLAYFIELTKEIEANH
ncbi:MLP-like protein 28 [Olea europaea var. sylvestris]|uniref:Kirola-like n=1 Tax=Olea europaea subsp. europaea TaxID=158383 RepID=A0A8S0SNM2_OLEEU|nr:MLP-like protein 28 [Olea europaea var. sylvestris]CAA2994170.1 kirola-like [Olea europaea subsp. europaea]